MIEVPLSGGRLSMRNQGNDGKYLFTDEDIVMSHVASQ